MTDAMSKFAGTADAYENYMGRWSRKVAPRFVEWLKPASGKSWVDVGCGSGALTSAIAAACKPSRLVGIDSSASYVARAAKSVPLGEFREGRAISIDLPNDGFDYAVSGLVLNFIADPPKAINEMARVVRPGGTVALYVWDYGGHMQIMRYFFDCARPVDPKSSEFDDGIQAPICRPGALADAFGTAGLADVATTAIDITAAFADFDDYWKPFLAGTGSAPKYCQSLDEATRRQIRDAIQARLPTSPDGEILLAVRAWAVKGRVPA
jgi:SAM-dependent methyltransferase